MPALSEKVISLHHRATCSIASQRADSDNLNTIPGLPSSNNKLDKEIVLCVVLTVFAKSRQADTKIS